MQLKNVQEVLSKFGQTVVKESKNNLVKLKKHKGGLYKSLSYVTKEMPNSIRLKWFIAPYGSFVDQGVRGAGSSSNTNTESPKNVDVKSLDMKNPEHRKIYAEWRKSQGIV